MASGMTYTMTETSQLSTAEYYGKALCELGAEHKDVVALTADLAKSTKIGMFGEKFRIVSLMSALQSKICLALQPVLLKTALFHLPPHLQSLLPLVLLIRFTRISAIKMCRLRLLQLMQAPHSAKQAQLTIPLLI